jgi:hypothetical protein
MTRKTQNRFIAKLLDKPPVEWPATLLAFSRRHKCKPAEMDDIRSALDDHAIRCAFLSDYIMRRFGCDGCGEKSVDDAIKAAQKRQKKVKVALGYYAAYFVPFFSGTTPDEKMKSKQPRKRKTK